MPRIVLLTGPPDVGKTTVVRRVVERLGEAGQAAAGFITEEVLREGERVGFDLVDLDGERSELAWKGDASPARVGSYGVQVANVDAASERLLERLRGLPKETVVVIDEIGTMELYSGPFHRVVEAALAGPWRVLATVKQGGGRFERKVTMHREAVLVDVTEENRDETPQRVLDLWDAAGPA